MPESLHGIFAESKPRAWAVYYFFSLLISLKEADFLYIYYSGLEQ